MSDVSVNWDHMIQYADEKVTEYKAKQRPTVNLSVNERDYVIAELKNRIKRLEEDMAHILVNK